MGELEMDVEGRCKSLAMRKPPLIVAGVCQYFRRVSAAPKPVRGSRPWCSYGPACAAGVAEFALHPVLKWRREVTILGRTRMCRGVY
jgi:hypothetical protein